MAMDELLGQRRWDTYTWEIALTIAIMRKHTVKLHGHCPAIRRKSWRLSVSSRIKIISRGPAAAIKCFSNKSWTLFHSATVQYRSAQIVMRWWPRLFRCREVTTKRAPTEADAYQIHLSEGGWKTVTRLLLVTNANRHWLRSTTAANV